MATLDGHIIDDAAVLDGGKTHAMKGAYIKEAQAGAVATPATVTQDPAEGSTILRTRPVTITVEDAVPLRVVFIYAVYADTTTWEVVYDGDQFSPNYSNLTNVRATIEGGYEFTLLRDGGWPGSPTFTVKSVDAFGEEG